MNKNAVEVDCTRRCKSRRHGQDTSSITKRSVSDVALASFIKGTCANFSKAFDFEGRTALHTASSRGRSRLQEWLVRHSSDAFMNARDRESGYTPLHRSIFYGQIHCAVSLMKIGVNTDIVDKDDYKALEHAMLDRQYMCRLDPTSPSDVYVWGSNSNYTLGTGTQQQRNTPEMLNCFSRTNTSVQQVCLGKFHSVFVCSGAVYVSGQTGRAGGGGTALAPLPLRLPDPCAVAALTLTSTVLLLQSGAVIQYELNAEKTTATANRTIGKLIKVPNARSLIKLSEPIGVCAGRHHAVVWNAHAVYTWGTNLGQLGHAQEDKVVPAPKRVAISMNSKEGVSLQLVAAADAATVLTTSRGDVYLLHKYISKKIAVKQINLRQICVDAKVSEQGVYSRVTVLLLTNVGQLLIWQDATNKLTRCVFGLTHQTVITHVTLTHDALYFTTKYGEAFIGHISRKAAPTSQPQPIRKAKDNNKSALVKFLEKDDCTSVKITRIPNVQRAVKIYVDGDGLNFACLQIKPTCGLTSLPELSPSSLTKHMETLLETASEDDILHDVVFKVGTKLFPAHMFIIASSSEYLYKLYQEKRKDKDKPTIALENLNPEVFVRILRYMYTGTCDVAELGPCGLKIRKEDLIGGKKEKESNIDNEEAETDTIENSSEISAFQAHKQADKGKKRGRRPLECAPRYMYCDPVRLVQAAAKRLQVVTLHKLLDNFFFKDGNVVLKENATYAKNFPSWERTCLPELVDTQVRTKDGALVPAHKCVLAARLEYFQGMFMHEWTESKSLSTVTLPNNHGILLPVINFLYTDACPEIKESNSIDFLCSLLIVADQLLILRLREMCEIALANLITLKNCAELCQFAHTYNAIQLKRCCMEFICLNICCVLENRALDVLEEPLLEDISNYYCEFNSIMSSRVITPFYNAPCDKTIEEFAKNNPVDLDYTDEEYKRDDSVTEISKKKRQSHKIEYTDREKARMRYELVCLDNSLDLSNDTTGDITLSLCKINKTTEQEVRENQLKWTEVPLHKQQKDVQARLKAIIRAKDIMNEPKIESSTKLTKNNSSTSLLYTETPTTSRMSVSPSDSPAEMARSPPVNFVINPFGPKLSQKQRKKLAMENGASPPRSLDAYLSDKLNIGSPERPKNPWKICEAPVTASSPKTSKAQEFNQILADQKKQRDDFSRIMTKPLMLTQLEDKAIEDLERFYNIHEVDDEWITVRRIELQVSSPQWIHPHTAPAK